MTLGRMQIRIKGRIYMRKGKGEYMGEEGTAIFQGINDDGNEGDE